MKLTIKQLKRIIREAVEEHAMQPACPGCGQSGGEMVSPGGEEDDFAQTCSLCDPEQAVADEYMQSTMGTSQNDPGPFASLKDKLNPR